MTGAAFGLVQISKIRTTARVGSALMTATTGFTIAENILLRTEKIAKIAARKNDNTAESAHRRKVNAKAIQNELSARHIKKLEKVSFKEGTIKSFLTE